MRVVGGLLIVVLAVPVLAGDSREREYKDLVSLQGAERKAVYARFDGTAKAELWTLHLEKFVAAHPELTDPQRAMIAEGTELLASGVLKALKSTSSVEVEDARNAILAFEARATRLFSRELYSAAFVRLGPPTKSASVLQVSSLRPECFCNPYYDECSGGECYTGLCWVMPDGCGTFGWDICTGMC
jgi:hypothetical protein